MNLTRIKKEYDFWKGLYVNLFSIHSFKEMNAQLEDVAEFMNQDITNDTLLYYINDLLYRKFWQKEKIEKITVGDLLMLGDILKQFVICSKCRDAKQCPFDYIRRYPVVKEGRLKEDRYICLKGIKVSGRE